jgi:hypothetical protein
VFDLGDTPNDHPDLEGVGWLTSRWEEIDPRVQGRPARRDYQLSPDGVALAGRRWPAPTRRRPGPPGCEPRAKGHDRPHEVPGGTGQAGRPSW